MIREIEKIIYENGPRWETPFFPPRSLFFVKTSGSKRNPAAQPVVFLLFDQRGPHPRWVVKVSRDLETASFLQKEYQNLLYFYHALSPSFRKTLPKPLLSKEDHGQFLFVETGLQGTCMPGVVQLEGTASHQKQIRNILGRAKAWLLRFQSETQEGEVEITEKWIEEEVGKPLEQYRSRYPLNVDEASFFEEYLQGWTSWIGTRIPLVSRHGDFWMGNMIMDGQSVSVFDWTFSKRRELPFDDLFFFVSSFLVYSTQGSEGREENGSFQMIFFNEHWFSQQIKEILVNFFFQLKLSPFLFPQLFPLFLLKMAIRKEDEYQAHALRNSLWKERMGFYIQNWQHLIEI